MYQKVLKNDFKEFFFSIFTVKNLKYDPDIWRYLLKHSWHLKYEKSNSLFEDF